MNDLVNQTEAGRELSTEVEDEGAIPVGQRLALIKEALLNPDVAPDKARAVMEMMTELEDRDSKRKFMNAKVAALAAIPIIGKNKQGHNAPYSDWAYVKRIIDPILAAHGLTFFHNAQTNDSGMPSVQPVLEGYGYREEGGWLSSPPDTGGKKTGPQAVVSAKTLLERHTAKSMLGLKFAGIVDDDDGASADGGDFNAYEHLSADQRSLVDEARQMSLTGSEQYEAYFKELKPAQRAFLHANTAWPDNQSWHDQNKHAAQQA